MKPRFALLGAVVSFAAAQAALAADVRVTDVELSFFTRERGGWVQAREPVQGGMLAIRCSYELVAGADERPAEWFLAFVRDGQELRRARGGGLVDADTGRASRTWYGLIAAPGSYEVGCIADPDGELAESDEGNNRLVKTLAVPGEGRSAPRRTPLVGATAGQAAGARGQPPALDLEVTDESGIRREGKSRSTARESITSAVVGEALLIDCRFRAHVDSVNSEAIELPAWTARLEREGAVAKEAPGRRQLVHGLGTASLEGLVERWTPAEPGRYVFRCLLDPAGVVTETDRRNNARELVVDVVPAGAPAAAQVAQAAKPELPPAQLGFVTYNHEPAIVMGPTEQTLYGHKEWYDEYPLTVQLIWESPFAAQFEWRWQAALWPFPASSSIEPEALLADGKVTGNVFTVDLSTFPPLGTRPQTAVEGPPGNVTAVPAIVTGAAKTSPGTAAVPAGSAAVPQTAAAGVPVPPAASGARRMPDLSSRAGDAGAAVGRVQPGSAPGAGTAATVPEIDFTTMPVDIYLRIVPIVGGKPAGTPSNFVVAHYVPDVSPGSRAFAEHLKEKHEQEQKLAEMSAAADVFDIALVSFEQPLFFQPDKWGCVKVLKNPYFGEPFHPLMPYAPGTIACPPLDEQYMEKDWDEKAWEVVESYGIAWNKLVEVFDYGKSWVAKQWAEGLPCEWLGDDLEDDCEGAAAFVAKTAINAGLAAAGVPPTLPDLKALGQAAKGEIVNAAVEATCDVLESQEVTCTPEMRDALAELYSTAVDEMQKMATREVSEPGCGDPEEAGKYGKKPLPCFTSYPGVEVEPAPEAVDTSPAVTVSIRRTAPDPDFPMDCSVHAGMTFTKDVPGLSTVSRDLWAPGHAPIPPLSVGQAAVVRVELGLRQLFEQMGAKGKTIDWWGLLPASTAELRVGTSTAQAVAPGPVASMSLQCSNRLERTVQVPETGVTSKWVVM